MRKFLFLCLIYSLGAIITNAQKIEFTNECTIDHQRARIRMKIFLQYDFLQEERISTGTTNIPIEEIQHVTNPKNCLLLKNIVKENSKLTAVYNDPDPDVLLFFYQTNNFYFIFWDYPDNKIRTGPRTIFAIVKKIDNQVSVIYI